MRIHEGKLPPKLRAGEAVALDLEMFNQDKRRLHRPHGDFACLSAAVGDDVYQVYTTQDAAAMLRRVGKANWALQKGDYDFRHLRGLDLSVPPRRYWDTMYVEQALYSGWYNRFGLDSLSRRWLQKPMSKEAREDFYGARRMTKEMKRYAARDAWATLAVAEKQRAYIKDNGFEDMIERVWYETDLPALWAILDMRGVTLDTEAWLKLAAKNRILMAEGKAKLDFDPGSNKQVAEVLLAAGVKLPKTDKGNYSTKDDVIAPYADDYEVVRTVLAYREAQKQAGTYGEKFVEWVEADGRLHPCFNLNGAVTSRLSSENPCVNVPKKPEEVGRPFRSCFVPAPGHVFVKMDYAQCQVYVLAHVAQDQPMIEALKAGQDIHRANAAWLYGVPYDDVTSAQRKHAKGCTFGIIFNIGAGTLAENEGIPRAEAKRFIDAFFAGHPGVNAWANRQRAMQDFVETPGGRRIWLNPYMGKHGENVAMNYPIQAGEAEIHKRMLAKMHFRWPAEWGQFGACILAHDEILTEVKRKHARACAKLVRECALEAEAELLPSVPPAADVEVVKNWWGDPLG